MYGELDESLLAEFAAYGNAAVLGAKWNQTEKNLTFPNGSVLHGSGRRPARSATSSRRLRRG